MNENKFSELLESIKEVGLIEAGKSLPVREFTVERHLNRHSSSVSAFAICLTAEDENLIPLKIYHVTLQPAHKTCTVKDENDETTVCPVEWFLPIELPSRIEEILERTELALA